MNSSYDDPKFEKVASVAQFTEMQTIEGDQITPNMTPNLHNIVLDGSGEPVSTMTVVKGATL